MRTALRIFSAAVFLGSGAVFLFTLRPGARITMDDVWPLPLAVMVAYGAAIYTLNRMRAQLDRQHPGMFRLRADAAVLASVPLRAWVVGIAGMVLIGLVVTRHIPQSGGTPGVVDGKLVLHSHGRVIREITAEEAQRREAEITREFASVLLFFSWASVAFFWLGPWRPVGEPRPDEGGRSR
jgi:hypothetical protein